MVVGIIDRERETEQLHRLAAQRQPRLGILFGRRQIGKTFLLRNVWGGKRLFYFLAAAVTGPLNRQELVRDLQRRLDPGAHQEDFPTWRSVFRRFVELARHEPLIVVIDEFQYLLNDPDDIVSQLAAVWDLEAQGVPLVLLLSGSAVSTLERLHTGDSPLYGRVNWAAKLSPFDYFDTARMLPGRKAEEQALLYGIFGGTPRYLAAIEPKESLAAAASRLMLSADGEVHLQMGTLIEQERGIREPAEYRAVLSAVARNKIFLNDISQAAGVPEGTPLRRILSVLEELELVRRERNFGAHPNAAIRYRIADPAVGFWYSRVQEHRSRLELGAVREVWEGQIQPSLNDMMGFIFERICQQAYQRRHQAWGLPGINEWANWQGVDRLRRDVEIDCVARLDDGRMLTGEFKWTNKRVGPEVHFDLLRDLRDLASSGQAWAHEATDPARSAGYLYIAKSGFTDSMLKIAEEDPRMHLLTLADLYGEV